MGAYAEGAAVSVTTALACMVGKNNSRATDSMNDVGHHFVHILLGDKKSAVIFQQTCIRLLIE